MSVDPFAGRPPLTLDPESTTAAIRQFLAEDVGTGDATTARLAPPDARAAGSIVARETCIVAGLPLAEAVFRELDPAVAFEAVARDGDAVAAGAALARLCGPAAPILTGERLALNLLQRLSGIATVTRLFVTAVAGTGATISDTRKTTPGLRLFEKYAVRMGGGRNHRFRLDDAVLIKDNHVAVAGGIERALELAKACEPGTSRVPVQLEVDSLEQLDAALDAGIDAVLLDNMPPETVAAAVARIRAHPAGAACWIEASGGITLPNVRAYGEAGVDTISVGALTHSAPSEDIALDFDARPEERPCHG
jgi:nicotinate-nucleotide pyrophosphorylase (carboxylating)